MKNKRHQCAAEVQLIWMYNCTYAIMYPSHVISNSKALYFIEFWCKTPSFLLTRDPSLLLQLHKCTTVLYVFGPQHCNPLLQRVDQSVPREFSWWGSKLCTAAVGWTLNQKCPKRSRSCRQQNTMDQGWHHYHSFMEVCYYYYTTYFSTYLLSKLISEKESFNLFYEMLLIPPRCYRFTPKI